MDDTRGGIGVRVRRSAIAVMLALLSLGWGNASANSLGGDTSLVGKPCPEVRATDFDGADVRIPARVRGTVQVVNFWGIRCGACLEEMPKLDDIHKRLRDRGVSVYGVNVDGAGTDILAGIMKKMSLSVSYHLLPDTDFRIMDAFRVTATPLTVVIDDGGTVVYQHEGYVEGDEKVIEARIQKLLGAAK